MSFGCFNVPWRVFDDCFHNFFTLAELKMWIIFAFPFRAISSVGSEHLPYKQGVVGSIPTSPTVINRQL